jgi:hypothetical protein
VIDRRIRRELLSSPARCNDRVMLELSWPGDKRDSWRAEVAREISPSLPSLPIRNEDEGFKSLEFYVVLGLLEVLCCQ